MNILRSKGALWAGFTLIFLGLLLLFWTNPIVQGLLRWWPLGLTLGGLVSLLRFAIKKGRPRFLLFGLIFVFQGLLIQAITLGAVELDRVWPAFAAIISLSLIPYAFHLRRNHRLTLLIPAVVLLFFSLLFFLFTFNLVPEDYSFSKLATQWWPVAPIVFGLGLVVSYYFQSPGKPRE